MKKEIIISFAKVAEILAKGGYEFNGLRYDCISSSSHVTSHSFQGVEIRYFKSDMEYYSKGKIQNFPIYAYFEGVTFEILK